MLYDELPNYESRFAANLTDSDGKVFTAGTSIYPGATRLLHRNNNWFYQERTPKNKVVLHFTMGNIWSDVAALTHHYVSVAYLVARSGVVYELFDPDLWSYHLGPTAVGGNSEQSKSSIAIEISNYGPLVLAPNGTTLNTAYGSSYCALAQTDAYLAVPGGFRGYHYFATFTDEQYAALQYLVPFLTKRYGVPAVIPTPDQQGALALKAPPPGIWSHQNYRKDKVDVGPALDWTRIGI